RLVDEEPRGGELGRHLGDLELDRLELGDLLPELLALLYVIDGGVECSLRDADHLRADADAALVERLDRDLVALADLAEDVRLRERAVLEEELELRGGADP